TWSLDLYTIGVVNRSSTNLPSSTCAFRRVREAVSRLVVGAAGRGEHEAEPGSVGSVLFPEPVCVSCCRSARVPRGGGARVGLHPRRRCLGGRWLGARRRFGPASPGPTPRQSLPVQQDGSAVGPRRSSRPVVGAD